MAGFRPNWVAWRFVVSEQPVERPAPESWAPVDVVSDAWARAVSRRRPTVVVKADLLPAVSVVSTTALLGLLIAWIWARIAPAVPGIITQTGQPVALPSPFGYHRFDDLAIFLLLGFAAGLVAGVATWLLRERRGPTIMLAAVLGSLVGAWLAVHTGLSFAAGHYPISGAPKVGAVIDLAPRLETGWVLLAQPLGTALAYGVLAAWNGMNDLGRRFG
jgi:hypothetical protein